MLLVEKKKTSAVCISVQCTIVCWFTEMVSQYLILCKINSYFLSCRVADPPWWLFLVGVGGVIGAKYTNSRDWHQTTEGSGLNAIYFIPFIPCLLTSAFINLAQHFIFCTMKFVSIKLVPAISFFSNDDKPAVMCWFYTNSWKCGIS